MYVCEPVTVCGLVRSHVPAVWAGVVREELSVRAPSPFTHVKPCSLRSVAMNNSGKLTSRKQRLSLPTGELPRAPLSLSLPVRAVSPFSYQMVAALLVVVVLTSIGHLSRLHVQLPVPGLLPGVLRRLRHRLLVQGVAVVLVLSLRLFQWDTESEVSVTPRSLSVSLL